PRAGHLAISGGRGYAGTVVNPHLVEVAANASVTLSGLTLEHGGGTAYGYAANSSNGQSPWDQDGGAILNLGTLTVSACTLTGNSAGGAVGAGNSAFYGGAIYNAGTLTVTDSLLSDNAAGLVPSSTLV